MTDTIQGEALSPNTLTTLGRLSSVRRADERTDSGWLADVVLNQHYEDGHRDAPQFCYSAACQAADEVKNGDPRNGVGIIPPWMQVPTSKAP